jgi:cysteine-rich repeat protein
VQENEALRNGFRAQLQRFVDEVWNSDELVQLLDDVSALYDFAAITDPRHPLDANRLASVRQCLQSRPGIVQEQLDAVCGDGVLQAGEGCDDGGAEPHDGCSAACQSECGNGQVDGEEQCDDGNPWGGDGCNEGCRFESGCGDGVVQWELLETCDDGANGDSFADGCRDDCSANACGDGRLDAGEDCDDGDLDDLDGCDASCADEDGVASCGNGVLEAGETCDDGNVDAGDACDEDCARPCDDAGADVAVVWGANGHCYQLFGAPVDWATALGACEAVAGHLVTITRDGENRMLAQLGAGWIGLSDIDEEGSFGWVNGEPYELDAFMAGQPDDWGGNEDCGELAGLGWNDLDCAQPRAYFCEID